MKPSLEGLSEDREEGEIVEDELEDVSDCSLTAGSPLNTGKSVSHPEILNGVCLSRPSNRPMGDKASMYYKKQRRRIHHKRRNSQNVVSKKIHHSTPRRPSIIEIVSDSEEEIIDPMYAKQLREALCRESAEASTNNSLKTRLKAFIDGNSHSEDESNINALRNLALLSTLKPVESSQVEESLSKDTEAPDCNTRELTDSIDPELQELRLEALKSVIIKNHESRKRKANQAADNTHKGYNNIDATDDINKENNQSIINNKKIKIDADGVVDDSPKSTVDLKSDIEKNDSLEEDADILRAVLLASMSTKLARKPHDLQLKVAFEPPKVIVKPLIINLNADSDSDTDKESGPSKNNTIKNTVSEFLKRQRAEVEANVRKKSINTTNILNVNKRNDLMNKSVMKLLPRSQQLEYHKLKQQLLNANKKVRNRKNSLRVLHNNKKDVNQLTNSTKKLPFYKNAASVTNNNRILVNNKVLKNNTEKQSETTISHLQKTIEDLQVTENGRLQMKGKYRSLGPLLNKINQASYERQKHEINLKKLLQEMKITRTNFAKSNEIFSNLVQLLVKEKSAIDTGVFQAVPPAIISSVSDIMPLMVENKETKDVEVIENCLKETEPQLLDPNDITKVFVKGIAEDVDIPKYTSPLNYRNIITDPKTIICPYDLLGVCKDKECQYVHYA